MRSSQLCLLASAIGSATAGFTVYKEIREGADNSGEIAYNELDRSDTLFLNIQITPGGDHQDVIADFKTLAQNYGAQGIKAIPRVRYGQDSNVAPEPNDRDQVLADVSTWAQVFSQVTGIIELPVIQAGFLGLWGEWHDGPFCQAPGTENDEATLEVKRAVVETLLTAGSKVALRNPRDHQPLFEGNTNVTIHNDCIFDGGPTGNDGGTFPGDDRQTWVDYTVTASAGNSYGGEPCNQAGDSSTYDWSNFDDVCGSNGLETYIHYFQISYLNPGNPPEFYELFTSEAYSDCVNAIGAALDSYK